MAEDKQGQGETPETVPASETPASAQPQETKSAAELDAEVKELRKQLKTVNNESATRRKRLEELEAAEEQRKSAELSEAEKLKKDLETAKANAKQQADEFNSRLIRAEIKAVAAKLGFNDPEDADTPAIRAQITINDNGDVEGVEDALATLAKNKPYLVGTPQRTPAPSTNAGQGNAPVSGEALTPGQETLISIANASGFEIDPDKVRQHKANARLVTALPAKQ